MQICNKHCAAAVFVLGSESACKGELFSFLNLIVNFAKETKTKAETIKKKTFHSNSYTLLIKNDCLAKE